MIKHSLLIIYRNLKRSKGSFFINFIGLSTGITCALLIYLWVNDELSFDKFHLKNDRLFQVMQNVKTSDNIITWEMTPSPLAEALTKEMPEVEFSTVVFDAAILGRPTLIVEGEGVKGSCLYVGESFFNVFSFELLKGDANQALLVKNSIVISEELAMKLFGTTENITGKMIDFQKEKQLVVTGIFKRVPNNSSIQFDFVLPYEALLDKYPSMGGWKNSNPNTYVILKKGTNVEHFNDKIARLIEEKCSDTHRFLFLRPFSDRYLYNNYENGVLVGGRIEYVKLFSIIGIFILIIACINFMNLSTAKASMRIKEIGVKKAIGADRLSLILQHLGESILMVLLFMMVAILFAWLLLPQFNEITGKHITMNFNSYQPLIFLVVALLTGFISGSYPALYLSGFKPAIVLKGKFQSTKGEMRIRKGLVVFQFVLSSILIVSVLVVYKQIQYMQSKKLGYNKDNIIYFDKEGKAAENRDVFISEMKTIPGVINASSSGFIIVGSHSTTGGIKWEGKDPNETYNFDMQFVNYDFIELHEIKMKEGRSFSRDFGTDNSSIIFNETAIKAMGLKEPIGKTVNLWGKDRQIIGVTSDFHFESLQKAVNPVILIIAPPEQNLKFLVKIKVGTEKETLSDLKKFYGKYNPGFVFDYKFLDDDYQAQYDTENRVAVLSRYFAILAIIISCLGLYGLSAFTTEKRYKEVGIRKSLGSTDLSIIYLFSKDITKPVIIALFIALPISYFIAKSWLNGFAYKVDLKLWYFIGTAILTLLIAWITVGTQTLKAAKIEVSECLRFSE